ncbi:MAG: hypothetical protein N2505_00330 [Endomicrobia bacterium]|nr:hypothetical protein [Endomicrobiia bacterium]
MDEKKIIEILKEELPSYRDKNDIEELAKKNRLIIILCILLCIQSVVSFYLYIRKPVVYVFLKDNQTQQVIAINDKTLDCREVVEIAPPSLTNEDKLYLAKEFSELLYSIELPLREKNLQKLLNLISDKDFQSKQYQRLLQQYNQEKQKETFATWKILKMEVDSNDRMKVRLIGEQNIREKEQESFSTKNKQYELLITLSTNNERTDRNLRTGFLVSSFEEKLLKVE